MTIHIDILIITLLCHPNIHTHKTSKLQTYVTVHYLETYLKALSPKSWLSCLVKPYQSWTNELYRMEFFRGSLGFSLWIRGRCSRMRQCRNEWPQLTTFLDVSFTMMYQHTSPQRTSLWTALFLTTTWYIPGENKEMKINGEMCQAVDFRPAVTVCYSVQTTLCLEAIKGLSYLACTQKIWCSTQCS